MGNKEIVLNRIELKGTDWFVFISQLLSVEKQEFGKSKRIECLSSRKHSRVVMLLVFASKGSSSIQHMDAFHQI